MLTQKNTLLAKVYKSRYFSTSDPLSAPLVSRPSFAWKSIHAAQAMIKQGARAVVGNGESINIWKNQWTQAKPARPLNKVNKVPHEFYRSISKVMLVKDLLETNGREWNRDLLSLMFSTEDMKSIEEIRPGGNLTKDGYNWDYSRSGHYSVKSGYWVQTQVLNKKSIHREVAQPSLDPLFQQIWQLDAPPKVHHFIWKCLSISLSVAGNLSYRHLMREGTCLRCPDRIESVNHLLFNCHFARLVWEVSPIPVPSGGVWEESIYTNLWRLLNLHHYHP